MQYKNYFLSLICFTLTTYSHSQTAISLQDCGLTYLYDNAGNRIVRLLIPCNTISAKTDDENYSAAVNTLSNAQDSVLSQLELTVLYPNPTDGNFKIVFNQELFGARVSIRDNYGKNVLEQKVQGLEIPLDISEFSAGVYFVTVFTSQKKFSKAVVKQ